MQKKRRCRRNRRHIPGVVKETAYTRREEEAQEAIFESRVSEILFRNGSVEEIRKLRSTIYGES